MQYENVEFPGKRNSVNDLRNLTAGLTGSCRKYKYFGQWLEFLLPTAHLHIVTLGKLCFLHDTEKYAICRAVLWRKHGQSNCYQNGQCGDCMGSDTL